MAGFLFVVNLDERGEFYADVRREDGQGETVFEMHGDELVQDGFLSCVRDMDGLHQYLVDCHVLDAADTLTAE